jgi:hypothetical protein
MNTILTNPHTCLFCGKPIEQQYEERTPYYECECPDAKQDRSIDNQIRVLESNSPKKKFRIEQRQVLYPVSEKN